uniref:Carcinoembryonic antigen-related cell adhesion molecule 1 n=2 Tax=Xenopus tropicalis TaxID=8364 RepID=A0A803JRS6_XENTR
MGQSDPSQGLSLCILLLSALGAVRSVENVTGTEGKSVYLTVKLDLPAQQQVTWRVNSSTQIVTVYPGGSPIYTDSYRDRCTLYGNTTLRLDNLTPTDTGEYSLSVTNPNSGATQSGSVYLTVYSAERSIDNVAGTEGKSVYLTVRLDLPAQRQVTWRVNSSSQIVTAVTGGSPVYAADYRDRCHLYGNATLQLDNLTPADTGEYTLSVANVSTGATESGSVYLTVYSSLTPPTLKVNVPTTNGNAYPVNDTVVSLHCDAGVQNVVNYTFYRDGVPACSQPHVTCNKDFLYFQPITMSDTGRYTCKIENPVSSNTSQPLSLTVIARVSGVALSSNASGLLWAGKDSVRLTCSALGTNVTFSWHLDGAPLPTNPRYHLMNSNSSLIISPVERTDNGSFTCTASNSVNSETSSPLTLSLGCPLTLPALKVNVSTTNGNAYPVNGTIVSLHCDAGGQNVVNYTFYRDGVTACSQPHVTCDKDFLYFQPIMMRDTGTYTCKIENPISSNTSQPLSLTVTEPVPGVALSSNASSGLLCPGKDSVRLTCSALGTNVTFSWHLDGAPLPTNPRYHLMNSNSSLIISPVERTDNGSFTCTASNSLNSKTSSPLTLSLGCPLTLPALKVNVSTTNGNAYPVNGTIVSLHCDTGGQNVVNYTFYKDGATACSQPHVTCDKDFLYFQPIMMRDTGTYTCKIENRVSSNTSQPLSLTVIARVSGVALSSNASGLLCPGKDSVRLTCSALGTNVTFSWHLDGAPLPTNPRYHLMNSNSSLIISPVERTDSGSFTCTASNSVNSETSSPLTLNLGCSNHLSPGAIAGIVIAALFVVALIPLTVIFILCKKNKNNTSTPTNPVYDNTGAQAPNTYDRIITGSTAPGIQLSGTSIPTY